MSRLIICTAFVCLYYDKYLRLVFCSRNVRFVCLCSCTNYVWCVHNKRLFYSEAYSLFCSDLSREHLRIFVLINGGNERLLQGPVTGREECCEEGMCVDKMSIKTLTFICSATVLPLPRIIAQFR